MADSWRSATLKFSPFDPLKGPLQSVLTLLETVEAILESLLDIIKAFQLDFVNPLKALIALLLAAVRAIINQIKSTGFAILLVHPDFSRQDFGAVLQSVSGAYPSFESKVVSKFYDSSDIFRPQYPPGSSVAMLIFYIGAESPGDLLSQLFALMQMLKTPVVFNLPAPVGLKVNPVRKSGDPVANFRGLFDSDLQKALVLEWQMPMTPSGSPLPGFMNSMVSFYNSFRFPSFIVERSETPQGEQVTVDINSQTMGKTVMATVKKYNLSAPITQVAVREENGDVFRNFPKKMKVSGTQLTLGAFSSTYRYVDDDSSLESGKAYFYRVRAYFGSPSKYLATTNAASVVNDKSLIKYQGNQPFIRYDNGSTVGPASPIVRGFVPRTITGAFGFNPYDVIYQAVQTGILLNFEFPPPTTGASTVEIDQRAGWGVLAAAAGQMGPVKAAYETSNKIKDSLIFKTTCRRVANQTLTNLYSQPAMMNLISGKWNDGVQETVNKVFNAEIIWSFPSVVGGFTTDTNGKISNYLSGEQTYISGQSNLSGPYPTYPFQYKDNPINVSADDRRKLADFLRLCLTSLSGNTTYLSWYSVTIGDLFPAFIPFIFDFEQWILALLKALESAISMIEDIIETLITKIQQLEQIIESILALIDLLSINVRVSVLAVSSTNGSASSLAQALLESDSKPAASPFGLHSGLVCTFGGPGAGSVAAFKAIRWILTL
jgi:hypothetical protein